MRRGDIVALQGDSDSGKPRPALVVQADWFDALATVVVLPLTSAVQDAAIARVDIAPSEGTLRRELHQIGQDARYGLAQSQAELNGTVRELRGVIGSARNRELQQQWLWAVGAVGVMSGMLLWFLLTATLPWGGGTWLAGLAFGGTLERRPSNDAGRQPDRVGAHGAALQGVPTGQHDRTVRGGDRGADRSGRPQERNTGPIRLVSAARLSGTVSQTE